VTIFYLPGCCRYWIYLQYNSWVTSVQKCRKTVIGVEMLFTWDASYVSPLTSSVKMNAKCFVVWTTFYMNFCCHYDHLLLLCLHQADFCQIRLFCQSCSKKYDLSIFLVSKMYAVDTRINYILLRSGLSSGCGCTINL
jgi:hypothetical protein